MARNDFFLSCFVQEVGEVPIGRNVIFYHNEVAVGVVFSCFCFTKLPFLSPLQIVRLARVNPSRPFVGRGVDLLLLRLVLSCIYHCERRQSSFTTFDRHALLARWRGCLHLSKSLNHSQHHNILHCHQHHAHRLLAPLNKSWSFRHIRWILFSVIRFRGYLHP